MAFNIGGGAPAPFVGNLSPRGNNRGAVVQTTKGVQGGLPLYENTYDERSLGADSQFEIAKMPWQFKREVFGQVFPLIQGMGQNQSAFNFDRVGGQNTPLPQLPNSFVYSPDQIQQQVNTARAQGDQSAATARTQATGEAAGRGFSARSPMVQALNAGINTATAASNADQERQIRYEATGANATQGNTVAGLANQQWNFFNNADIERRKAVAQSMLDSQRNMAALISAMGSLG